MGKGLGLLLFVLSQLLGIMLFPVGILCGIVVGFVGHRPETGIRTASDKFWLLAVSFDKYGNVVCAELFNATLITKKSVHRFGMLEETISAVIGYNLQAGTLSKAGKTLNWMLNFIDPGHTLKAIQKAQSIDMKKTIIALVLAVVSLAAFAQKKNDMQKIGKKAETAYVAKDTAAKPAADTLLVATVLTQKEFDSVIQTIRENLNIGNLETKALIQFLVSRSKLIPNKESK